WSMDGKKIRLGSNFIHFHLLDLRFLGLIVGQIRVEGNDSHAEALRTFGYTEPDFTNTDDAKCLAVHFSPLVSFPVPCTCRKLFMCSGDVARELEHHCHCMLSRADRIAVRCIYDNDATFCGSIAIDVVHADSGTGADSELPCITDDLFRVGRPTPDAQCMF